LLIDTLSVLHEDEGEIDEVHDLQSESEFLSLFVYGANVMLFLIALFDSRGYSF